MSDLHARIAQLERHLAALTRRHGGSVSFVRSTAPPVDSGAVQTLQGRFDALSLRDAMPNLQQFGFSSSMPPGGDGAVLHLNGERTKAVIIATGHQSYRLTGLANGNVALYDMFGHTIILGSTGISVLGNVAVTGNITATGSIQAGFGGADQIGLQSHIHVEHGTGGGTTSPATAGT